MSSSINTLLAGIDVTILSLHINIYIKLCALFQSAKIVKSIPSERVRENRSVEMNPWRAFLVFFVL
jgi:hypothetical protein